VVEEELIGGTDMVDYRTKEQGPSKKLRLNFNMMSHCENTKRTHLYNRC